MYYKIEIKQNNTFSIAHTQTKPEQHQCALTTLSNIRSILENSMVYLKDGSQFSKLTDEELLSKIRSINKEINWRYQKKYFFNVLQAVRELFSKTLSVAILIDRFETRNKIKRLASFIKSYQLNLEIFLPVPNEIALKILDYLPPKDQLAAGKVNRLGNQLVQVALMDKAKRFGYHPDQQGPKAYLDRLFKEAKFLCEKGVLPKDSIIYREKKIYYLYLFPVKKRELDIEATLAKWQKFSAVQFTGLFLNKQFYTLSQTFANYLLFVAKKEKPHIDRQNPLTPTETALQILMNKALSMAVQQGQIKVAEILLRHGADPNDPIDGQPALHHAVSKGHRPLASLLLKNGASINQTEVNGLTAVACAVQLGSLEMVKMLLDYPQNPKADLNIVDQDGRAPLHLAAETMNIPVMNLLLERGAAIEQADSNGLTPLCLASEGNCKASVKFLLEKGANPNRVIANGDTPLHLAAQVEAPGVIDLLLKHGALINQMGHLGQTPLSCAVQMLSVPCVKLLLSHNADPNIAAFNGQAPLHRAVFRKDLRIVKCLLDKGANVNQRGLNGLTPLLRAVKIYQKDVIEELLNRGADPYISDNQGTSPFLLVISKEQTALLEYLLKYHNNRINEINFLGLTNLIYAIMNGITVNSVKLIVKAGANYTTPANNGSYPLHFAAQRGDMEILNFLLNERGLDINTRGANGRTALSFAAEAGMVEAVQALLQRGADRNIRSDNYESPLSLAAGGGHTKVIELLRQAGTVQV